MVLSKNDIQFIINTNFQWVTGLQRKAIIVDNSYISLQKTRVLNIIKNDEWLKRDISYVPDVFDCDDYAMYLKTKISRMFVNEQKKYPGALGIIITTRHAFNFAVDNNKSVIIYDTVKTKLETSPDEFQSFLDIKPGNTFKLLYI